MTAGADAPLHALRTAPAEAVAHCHPCDEAVVVHLLHHVGRDDCELVVDAAVAPGTLALSLRLSPVALAS